jgi:hypothetical protein
MEEKEPKKPKATAPATGGLTGKPRHSTTSGIVQEKARSDAEEGVARATMQERVASQGALGGLGIGERGRVQAWLKKNPGKTVDDAKRALGMTAANQGKALTQ